LQIELPPDRRPAAFEIKPGFAMLGAAAGRQGLSDKPTPQHFGHPIMNAS
jgi:hypothetical protein